mgnify:CR=1 FL=1
MRLIGPGGEQLGIVPVSVAMQKAREAGLDLVEVAPHERPPVCRIMDYGKYRYELSRKQAKTRQHTQKLKEIRVRPKTGEHDLATKLNQARRFLEHKDKVLISVIFRGREVQHLEEGRRVLDHFLQQLEPLARIERPPTMEGKRMIALLAPKS